MKVMILAAGLGSRMRPLTDSTPKPLLEVGGKALIVWHIEKLASQGFREIIINVAHLGYQIIEALGDGAKWGVDIQYSDEQEEGALESAGGIVKALPLLGDETFLVVNADIFTDYDFSPDFHLAEGSVAHIVLVPNPEHNIKGDFALEDQLVIDEQHYTLSGIGYYSPKLFKSLSYGKHKLASLLREAMREKQVSGEYYNGKWFDIGTPERLKDLRDALMRA